MSTEPVCPCESFEHPATPHNIAGLERVRYRSGDFRAFRRALIQSLRGEENLTAWRPNAQGDLLLQSLEWWAYIADVLTFYNEQSINERLLRTATLDASVRGLVSVLGYRPRPGIGGAATLGVLLNGTRPVTLPAGFRVQSKPAPGQQPQTFETTTDYTLAGPDEIPVAPPGVLAGPGGRLYLHGKVKSIQPGQLLLLTAIGTQQNGTLIRVQNVRFAEDAGGNACTEIVTDGSSPLPSADAVGYQLLQSRRTSGLWKSETSINLINSPLELEGVDRSIQAGQAVVLNAPGTTLAPVTLNITATREQIWYMNGNGWSPPAAPTIPAGAPHTRVDYAWKSFDTTAWNAAAAKVQVLLGWEPAGTLRNVPVASYSGTPPTLIAQRGARFRTGNSKSVLLSAADGAGALAVGSVLESAPAALQIADFGVEPPPALATPLTVLENLITLTRGKTVERDVLGIGNARLAPQEFTLGKSPLTYLSAGDSYKSTLRLFVNGIEWTEVRSFLGQPPDATVFVTREDDEQKTHVAFGDWINGAGLPTGAEVTATYRIESGGGNIEPGGISVIVKPAPGVRGIRHGTLAGGGADPDPISQVRRYAPRSVLTFGRAISAEDYEAIAVRAPGVARVRTEFAWNAQEQRAGVTLYVGDDAAAVASARNALLESADPNRPVAVVAARRVTAQLYLAIRIAANRIVADVVAAVRTALADPDTGLLGSRCTGIGESFYFSQLSLACAGVPGVEAVNSMRFLLDRPDPVTGAATTTGHFPGLPPRINALAGEFFSLAPEHLFIFPEVSPRD